MTKPAAPAASKKARPVSKQPAATGEALLQKNVPAKPPTARPKKKATAPRKASTQRKPAGKKSGDDLTLINGIGPTFAKALLSAGYTTFKKLAEIDTPKKLENFANKVGIPADRIRNDKWIQAARSAHLKKYKERV